MVYILQFHLAEGAFSITTYLIDYLEYLFRPYGIVYICLDYWDWLRLKGHQLIDIHIF